MEENCKIIEDLLPSYIDKLTNEETNRYIEKHLDECEACRKLLEDMQNDLSMQKEKQCETETKYMKKFSKRYKILIIILLIIFATIATIAIKKAVVIVDLKKKYEDTAAKQLEENNFHIESVQYSEKELTIQNYYRKDNAQLGKRENYVYGKKRINTHTYYQSENEQRIFTSGF